MRSRPASSRACQRREPPAAPAAPAQRDEVAVRAGGGGAERDDERHERDPDVHAEEDPELEHQLASAATSTTVSALRAPRAGAPRTTPRPTVSYPVSSRIRRCPGLRIHAATSDRGVLPPPLP